MGDKTPTEPRAQLSTRKQVQIYVVTGLIFSTCSAIYCLQKYNLQPGHTPYVLPQRDVCSALLSLPYRNAYGLKPSI